MYAPFILPSTCILPAQKERIEHKLRAKQQAFAAESRDTFERILALGTSSAGADVKHLLDGPSIAAVSGYVTFSWKCFPLFLFAHRFAIQQNIGPLKLQRKLPSDAEDPKAS